MTCRNEGVDSVHVRLFRHAAYPAASRAMYANTGPPKLG